MAAMRVVQGKVHNPTAPRFTDAQVLVDADKPSFEHKMVALRLKFLLRFFQCMRRGSWCCCA